MRFLAALICIGLTLGSWAGPAEPENVLVEGYTLTRPTNWLWEAPAPKSKSLSRFVVPNKTDKPITDVSFFPVSGSQAELRERVLGNFDKNAQFNESPVKIAKTNITYVRVRGTATVRRPRVLPDYELLGVMLRSKDKDQWFFARIFGPRAEVQSAEADFKKMIERSLEEAAD